MELSLKLCTLLLISQEIYGKPGPYVGLDIEGDDFTKNNLKFVRNDEGFDITRRHQGFDYEDGDRGQGNNKNKNKGPTTTEDECLVTQELDRKELKEKPLIRKLDTKIDTDKEQVKENPLDTTECTAIEEMEPKTSVKIETYTVAYTVIITPPTTSRPKLTTRIEKKFRTETRKRVWVQRRRKIKKIINHPILIVKRRLVKERQTFERIIPKVIETREIINKPKVEERIEEGKMEEEDVDQPQQPSKAGDVPTESPIEIYETECEDNAIDWEQPIQVPNVDYNQPGLQPQRTGKGFAQPPDTRAMRQPATTPCSTNQNSNSYYNQGPNTYNPSSERGPGDVMAAPQNPGFQSRSQRQKQSFNGNADGYQSGQLYMVPRLNEYGQPVMSFYRGNK